MIRSKKTSNRPAKQHPRLEGWFPRSDIVVGESHSGVATHAPSLEVKKGVRNLFCMAPTYQKRFLTPILHVADFSLLASLSFRPVQSTRPEKTMTRPITMAANTAHHSVTLVYQVSPS